jgi:predicted enzyme related to lactoylglutathione lyase
MPKVVHFELPAVDPQRAIAFYEKVFGWTITKWDWPFDYGWSQRYLTTSLELMVR